MSHPIDRVGKMETLCLICKTVICCKLISLLQFICLYVTFIVFVILIVKSQKDQSHPVWGPMENYAAGREKRKQLLIMLCQHEADRLEVWAQPVTSK